MSFFIDTHCHLDLFPDIQQRVQEENNLPIKTISVTNAPSFYSPNHKLFAGSTNIRTALGLHPQLTEQYKGEIALFEKLVKDIRYIGEIGLDGSTELKSIFRTQRRLFEQILGAVRSYDNKILTIHSRNAATETIELLGRYLGKSNCKVILHWYSGSISDLKAALLKGFYFSINHKMVNTGKGKEIIKNIPIQSLLTETDAPFTFSGQVKSRIDSLKMTLGGIALLKNKSYEDLKALVYDNFKILLS